MIIYRIVNNINGKTYVGQTIRKLSERIAGHIDNKGSYIGNALRKYGLESFTVTVIDAADSKKVLDEKEIYWIAKLSCRHPNGYNFTDGGDGHLGQSPSEETRQKQRVAMTGQKRSEATKEKHRVNMTGDKNPAKRPDVQEKMRLANIGRIQSESEKANRSASLSGVPKSEEHRANISKSLMGHEVTEATKKGMRDHIRTEEHCQNISKALTGKSQSEESNQKRSQAQSGVPKTEEWKEKARHPHKMSAKGREGIAASNKARAQAKREAKELSLQIHEDNTSVRVKEE